MHVYFFCNLICVNTSVLVRLNFVCVCVPLCACVCLCVCACVKSIKRIELIIGKLNFKASW